MFVANDFLRQGQMVLGTCGVGVVENDGQTVAGAFRELHVALDDGLENQFLEMAFHLVVDLVGQAQTTVVHGQQESLDLQFRVEFALDDLDGVEQFADTF